MTNEFKGTPGPWRISGTRTIFGADKAKLEMVASVTQNHGSRRVDWEANARLIAAAPDLLEALLAYLHNDGADFEDEITLPARAAVAKALGTAVPS